MKSNVFKYFKKFLHSYIWLTLLLVIIDQITKYFALKHAVNIVVIPGFFSLELVRNTGAAWSILSGRMGLLATLSALAGAIIIYYWVKNRKKLSPLYKVVIATLLAGTLGNFIDRAFYKVLTGEAGVVDFLLFNLGPLGYFPTFNVADMCITLSLITLIVLLFISDYHDHKKAKQAKEINDERNDDERD